MTPSSLTLLAKSSGCRALWAAGAGWPPAHGPQAPARVQTRHQSPAPPRPAFRAIIYQRPGTGTPLPKRRHRGSQLCSSCKRNPPKSSQGIIPTTFFSTPKSNGFHCFLRSLQAQGVLAVTSGGFRSCLQLAARYRMLSVPLERDGGCSLLFLPSPAF